MSTSQKAPGDAGKRRPGRPTKFVDLEMVERLAHIQCTHQEIASSLNVSVDTLTRRKGFADVYKRGAEGGRKSLRRMQFESATKGNIAMQIWLGKQYLGQSEHVTSEIRRLPALRDMSSQELGEALDRFRQEYPDIAASVHAMTIDATVVGPQPIKPALLPAVDEAGAGD